GTPRPGRRGDSSLLRGGFRARTGRKVCSAGNIRAAIGRKRRRSSRRRGRDLGAAGPPTCWPSNRRTRGERAGGRRDHGGPSLKCSPLLLFPSSPLLHFLSPVHSPGTHQGTPLPPPAWAARQSHPETRGEETRRRCKARTETNRVAESARKPVRR